MSGTTVVFVLVGFFVSIVAHSLGRAIVGTLVGLRPTHVSFGVGAPVAHARLGGIVWIWGRVPLLVQANWSLDTEPRLLRRRLWLMTLGGLLGYVAVIVAVKGAGVPLLHDAGSRLPLQLVGTMSGLALLGSLFPITHGTGAKASPSDGLQLWRAIRAPQQDLVDSLWPCARLAAQYEIIHGDAAAALAICDRGLAIFSEKVAPEMRRFKSPALERLGRFDEAQALAAMNLHLPQLTPEARAGVLNDWSWFAFCKRDEADLRLADARSAEALALLPKLAPLHGTRGAVLLWRGRVSEALPLLESSLVGTRSSHGKAVNGALLAMACASRGQSQRALEVLEAARATGRGEPILAEAERCVAAAAGNCRVLFAERGRRALLVDPDGVELLEGVEGRPATREALFAAAQSRRRVTLSEIGDVRVARSPRGAARLLVVLANGRAWRLPLAMADLAWARMLAEDVLSPTRPPVPLPRARFKSVDVARGTLWLAGVAPFVASMMGVRFFDEQSNAPFLFAAAALVFRPAAPAALALATNFSFSIVYALSFDHASATLAHSAWLGGIVTIALVAGLSLRRKGLRPDGFGLVLGAMAVQAALEAVVAFGLARRGLDWRSELGLGAFLAPITSALVVVLFSRPRRA
jgi:hypothetical protein